MTTAPPSRAVSLSLLPGLCLAAGCLGRMAVPPVASPQGVTVTLDAPRAKRVSLVGEFNHWDPQRHLLVGPSATGLWTITLTPPAWSGRPARYRFLVDEKDLLRDPGELATAPDPFGVQDSLLTLSPPAGPRQQELSAAALTSAIETDPRPLPTTRAALLSVAEVAADLPPAAVLSMVRGSLLWGVEPKILGILVEPVAAAKREGIPVGLAVGAIEEGVLKQVPVLTIQAVVRESLAAARTAKALVDEALRDGLVADPRLAVHDGVEHLATLIRSGVPSEVLRELLRKGAGAKAVSLFAVDQTLSALDRFREVGMPFYLSLRVLGPALTQGYTAEQYETIERAVVRAKRRRVTLEEIAAALESGVSAGRDLDTIERAVDRLAPGSRGGMGSRFF